MDGKGADPHLHRHVVVFNATFDPDEGRIKAAEVTPLLLKRPLFQALFHAQLAKNVQALGYESIVQDRMILRSGSAITWSIALLLAVVCGLRFARWPWRRGLLVVLGGSVLLVAGSVALQAATPVSLDVVAWIVVLCVSFLAGLMRGTDALAARIYRKGMALLHRTAMMRAVLDDSFDGIIIADHDDRIEHANETAARLLGESAEALLGRPAASLFKSDAADPTATGQPVAATLARRDGSEVPVELVVSRSQLRGGRHRFERRHEPRAIVIWTFRDVTEVPADLPPRLAC